MSNEPLYKVGKAFPESLPTRQGAYISFQEAHAKLLICIPSPVSEEINALMHWKFHCGLKFEDGAMCFLWRFTRLGIATASFDSPFNPLLIKNIDDLLNLFKTDRSITLYLVDSESRELKGIRKGVLSNAFIGRLSTSLKCAQTFKKETIENKFKEWGFIDTEILRKGEKFFKIEKYRGYKHGR